MSFFLVCLIVVVKLFPAKLSDNRFKKLLPFIVESSLISQFSYLSHRCKIVPCQVIKQPFLEDNALHFRVKLDYLN